MEAPEIKKSGIRSGDSIFIRVNTQGPLTGFLQDHLRHKFSITLAEVGDEGGVGEGAG